MPAPACPKYAQLEAGKLRCHYWWNRGGWQIRLFLLQMRPNIYHKGRVHKNEVWLLASVIFFQMKNLKKIQNVWSAAMSWPCPVADAHILYISAHGRTMPVMNLGIQGKMVFVFGSIFESVFVFVFMPGAHILYIRAHGRSRTPACLVTSRTEMYFWSNKYISHAMIWSTSEHGY